MAQANNYITKNEMMFFQNEVFIDLKNIESSVNSKIAKVNENTSNVMREFNQKFEQILKEWFAEFTNGEEKMDAKACSNYITKVTGAITDINDERVTGFFKEYDKENTGFITEEKFLEFYLNALRTHKEDTVFENLKTMGIREDLHKMSEPYPVPYSNNSELPRFTLGNDKNFITNLFFFV